MVKPILTGDRRRIVVVGQAARDLVLRTDALPEAGGGRAVIERLERLGGKGANIAVGLCQLNPDATISLVAVLGTDAAGDRVYMEALGAGIETSHIVRRGVTALMVDVVSAGGDRRLLEDVPSEVLLSATDILDAVELIRSADIVVLQLQQAPNVILTAARLAHDAGVPIVVDGAIEGNARDELLSVATVVRANAHEASLMTGTDIHNRDNAARAAESLLSLGPALVALSVPGEGDLVAWQDGSHFYPYGESKTVDPTGAGDAFVAGLITGLRRDEHPREAGQLAADAAAATVQRLGGHPELSELTRRSSAPD